ncbi:MAG: hypothetical protein GY794_05805, partial [bacterium]|nr:hypothetical protein [bacterium]
LALGNGLLGIEFYSAGSDDNTIGGTAAGEGNIIAFNAGTGVASTNSGAIGNSILGNLIHSNGTGLGIDLGDDGVTANDANDADTGDNNLQNFPVITAAATAGSQIEISGTLDTDGLDQDYRIEFFATGTPDGTGYGEAERYLGYTTITTDGSGDATFTATIEALVYVGETITATATVDNGDGTYGDTSEFAANFTATTATNEAPTFMPPSADGGLTTAITSNEDQAHSVTVQSDGKILVAGYFLNPDFTAGFGLTRYNADGSLDTSFGGGDGIATTAVEGYGYSVVVQDDGKILVAGTSNTGDFTLARYNTDGTLDTSFDAGGDNDGIVITSLGPNNDWAYSVTLQSDGKILVAGSTYNGAGVDPDFALVRYTTDGTLDTSFDGDGIVITQLGSDNDVAKSVTVQADGKILVAGSSRTGGENRFALVRYNTDGTLDTSFDAGGDNDGIIIMPILGYQDYAQSVTVQSDGKILVAGYSRINNVGGGDDLALVRFNPDGTVDTSFDGDGDNDGIITTDLGSTEDRAYEVTLQDDGKILLAGYGNNDFALVRYNTDGSLDTTFDDDGIATTDLGTKAYGVALQSDGSILVAGQTYIDSRDFALVRYNADGTLDTSFDSVSTLNNTPTFIEDGAAVVLDATVDIRDTELDALNGSLGNYDGASVTLSRNGGVSTDDVFSFSDGNGITLEDSSSLNKTVLQKSGATIATFDTTT